AAQADILHDMDATPRRRWFQYRIATLLIVVTACAGGMAVWARARRMDDLANWHAAQAQEFQMTLPYVPRYGFIDRGYAFDQYQRRSRYHGELSRQYEQAAWRFWIIVDPGQAPEVSTANLDTTINPF